MVPQQSSAPNLYQDGLRMISYCPLCETAYNPMEARILDEKEDGHLLHIRCKKCWNSILALVLVSNVGVSSVGLVTDLVFEDVQKFRVQSAEVTVDDVLEIHEMLENDTRGEFIDAVLSRM